MEHTKIRYAVMFMIGILLLAGCSSSNIRNDFVKSEQLDTTKYEYVADIVVYKEGLSFLWFIPFASANEDTAKAMIRDKVKQKYPDAAGVYEAKQISRQGVGLFDWRPSIAYWGKIVKAR